MGAGCLSGRRDIGADEVNGCAPETRIDSGPADGVTTGSGVVFGYSSPDASAAGYVCTLDGVRVPDLECPGGSPAGGSASFAHLVDGPHTFTVAAVDAGGLADASPAARTWRVDSALDATAPETRIDSGPADGAMAGSGVVFGYSSPDASGGGLCVHPGRGAGAGS